MIAVTRRNGTCFALNRPLNERHEATPRPGRELALPKTEEKKPYVPVPPEDDIELEQDFELAAELEVGLADENLLGAPDPLASETGEVEGGVQPPSGQQHARTGGKGGTGRDAA